MSEPFCPSVWAYFRHLSGREYHAANAEHMQEEVLFTINWRNDITTAHVIRHNGVLWNITHVDKLEGYKGDITCIASGIDRYIYYVFDLSDAAKYDVSILEH